MGTTTELMQRYCAGDAGAFRQLYDELSPDVFRALTRLTGDVELARELLEQTFLAIHHSRRAYVSGADPMPWIDAIARRTFIDRCGASVRRYAG
ncbi:MAG: RNA polymerase sigma factor [Kofleriaceae bacterium]